MQIYLFNLIFSHHPVVSHARLYYLCENNLTEFNVLNKCESVAHKITKWVEWGWKLFKKNI